MRLLASGQERCWLGPRGCIFWTSPQQGWTPPQHYRLVSSIREFVHKDKVSCPASAAHPDCLPGEVSLSGCDALLGNRSFSLGNHLCQLESLVPILQWTTSCQNTACAHQYIRPKLPEATPSYLQLACQEHVLRPEDTACLCRRRPSWPCCSRLPRCSSCLTTSCC